MAIMLVNDEPLVSVVMNCYNGEKFLREAIDSVYAQSYTNWEIIFWDNASTDNSSEIAKSYNSKLKYFSVDETTLLGEARVLATEKAQGKYLAFLDVDDLWLEDKLAKQINQFKNSEQELGFVYGRTEIIFEKNVNSSYIDQDGLPLPEGEVFKELTKNNFIVFSSTIVDKDIFFSCGGFPKHFKNSTDYWIFLNISKRYSVGVVNDVCCKYRMHSSNLSASQYVICAKESIEAVSTFLPDNQAAKGLKYQYVSLAIMYLKEGKVISAFGVLLKNGGLFMILKRLISKITRTGIRKWS